MTSYSNGYIRWEPCPRRVRVQYNGAWIADSNETMLLLERGHLPVYYFPKEDVRMDLFVQTDHMTRCPHKGRAVHWTVQVGDQQSENAAWCYPEPLDLAPPLADYIAFYWDKMDHWFEEEEEIYGHPENPYLTR